MPFTAFHLGPALLIGIILFPFFDLAALLISSIIIDIEPFYVLFFAQGLPLHGFFHTFLGGTIVGVIVAIILWITRGLVQELLTPYPPRGIWASGRGLSRVWPPLLFRPRAWKRSWPFCIASERAFLVWDRRRFWTAAMFRASISLGFRWLRL